MSDEQLTRFTDDSVIRRISVPESSLCADALMIIVDNMSGAVESE